MRRARGADDRETVLLQKSSTIIIPCAYQLFELSVDINASPLSTWQAAIQSVWGKYYELLQLLISLSWFSEFIKWSQLH